MGQTDLTSFLNEQMDRGTDGTYTGGKGIVVRSPFDGLNDDARKKVLPATFWSNDIFAPSQLYPNAGGGGGNPFCPNDGWDGFFDTFACAEQDGETGPWNFAQLAVVIGTQMSKVFYDFDNIQSGDWGWGVFYATDSNSVDHRCFWAEGYNGWDCPGGWVDADTGFIPDPTKMGTGGRPAGNPWVDSSWGGGAGCHFSEGSQGIDQTDAWDAYGNALVGDHSCQCNYVFSDDWYQWVATWINGAVQKPGFEAYGWFVHGQAPSWGLDVGACWSNNIRDMIDIQNWMYWKRFEWSNGLVPTAKYANDDEYANVPYWGWNEVPLNRDVVTTRDYYDAVMIKLPAGACRGQDDQLSCMGSGKQLQVENDLTRYVDAGFLVLGGEPGEASMVLAAEYMDESSNYFRFFFCESWRSPQGYYQLVFEEWSETSGGACYLRSGEGNI